MSPIRTRMTSPGTNSRAAGVLHLPSRFTLALIASVALSAAIALPAWCSSQNPTTAFARSRTRMTPKSGHCRQDYRLFDHPRDRTPKIAEEFQELIGLLFCNLIGPILGQPLLRLRSSEAIHRRPQSFLHFRQGQGFQIAFSTGFRSRPRFKSLGLNGIGLHNVMPSVLESGICLAAF